LRVRTSNFAYAYVVLHYTLLIVTYFPPVWGIISQSEFVIFSNTISNVAQLGPANCHFDSLNLVRNSNLEFEFMHKIRATGGACGC
jgi:hypothetical protein